MLDHVSARGHGRAALRTLPTRRLAAALLGVLCLSLGARTLQAQTTCVGPAQGVPPSYNPPDWWDAIPPQPINAHRPDDPRWVGSARISYGDGATEEQDFRALHTSNTLFLSWRSRVAPAVLPSQNVLYAGFHQAAGGDVIITVSPTSLTQSATAGGVLVYLRNSDGTGTLQATPAWLSDNTRVWANDPQLNSWTVEMRVPITTIADLPNGLNLGSPLFTMWYEMLSGTPQLPVSVIAWPRTGSLVTTGPGPQFAVLYPDPAGWLPFRLSMGMADPSCATGGVSLAVNNVGTTNPFPSQILYKLPATGPQPINTFFADPRNVTGASVAASTIKAKFRLANWGTQPMGWEAGVSAADLWAEIPNTNNAPLSNSGAIADGTTASSTNDIRFQWTLTPAEIDKFENGTRRKHQCMLVELSSTSGVTFINDSVYRNMDLVAASKFSREAEVSVVGLPSIGSPQRDVYLWVETFNMPTRISTGGGSTPTPGQGGEAGTSSTTMGVRGTTSTTSIPRAQDPIANGEIPRPADAPGARDIRGAVAPAGQPEQPGNGSAPPEGRQGAGVVGSEELARLAARTGVDQLKEMVPTYIVHAFHDTGARMRIGGVERPILQPQTSFGYFVSHDGDLEGWRHSLEGAQEIAPNFFKISVPQNGVATVRTNIEARERERGCVSGCLSKIGLGALFGLAFLGLVVQRSKRRDG